MGIDGRAYVHAPAASQKPALMKPLRSSAGTGVGGGVAVSGGEQPCAMDRIDYIILML